MKKLILVLLMIMPFNSLFCKWEKVFKFDYIGLVACLTVADNSIYAGTINGVFVSTDEGKNWQLIYDPHPKPVFRCIIINDNMIYAGTSRGIHIS